MSTWRRPFALRLLAGLMVAALAWALMPDHAQAHGAAGYQESAATLAQALAVGSHDAAAFLPCGTQATCSPVIVIVQSTSVMLVGPCQPARARLCHDRRTHIHHHGQEPPPPRLLS